MRLIDADAVLAALSIFHDDTGNYSHFMNGIKTAREIIEDAPNAEAVLVKPLAERLAWYAMPPVYPKGLSQADLAEAWEEFLRGMEDDDEGD